MIRNLSLSLILVTCFSPMNAAEPESHDATAVASQESALAAAAVLLKRFWPMLQQNPSHYGLSPSDSIEALGFGSPLELQGITDEGLRRYQIGEPVMTISEPTGQWFVPLVAGGAWRAMVQVRDRGQGSWQGYGIGWAPLAKKWEAITRRWPATEQGGPQLFTVYSLPDYYFSVPSVSPPNLTEMPSLELNAEGSVPLKSQLNSASTAIEGLRKEIDIGTEH